MTNLTELEKAVLKGINDSDYGDNLGDPIWAGTERCNVPAKQVRGVLSSLAKKDLIFISNADSKKDCTYHITESGIEVCREHNLLGKFADDLPVS